MAVMSIVASGVGWVCCGIGAIVGPIFGIIALSQIKRTGEGGRNLAIAGITVGGVILVGLIIFWTAAFISAGNDDSYHQTHYRRGYGMVVPAAIPPVAAITAPAQ
ncbi:hypothetical protein A5634_00375 [Mycobacterium asiaticum]|uniref:DUF4190 domain-containing protein n=2 Tax=Mycobacterium asiaticum TaxID=1790 RepID=A0A1A3NQA4_MYCAS|nr:hypothetical protein A5634_00375 [Mycobacterium asiaticum]